MHHTNYARNRKERRALMVASKRAAKRGLWGDWDHKFEPGDTVEPPLEAPPGLEHAFVNNIFSVQVYGNSLWTRVMCRRHDQKPIGWLDLQRIKSELFGKSTLGLQLLPPENEVVDVANIYWFYIPSPVAVQEKILEQTRIFKKESKNGTNAP